MKTLRFILLILVLALSACGAREAVRDAVRDGLDSAISGTDTDTPDVAEQDEPESEEADIDFTEEDWDALQDWAHDQGWDGEGYHFPQVESVHEWPPARVWTELGLPELTPGVLNEGGIYNDGNAHIEGFSDTFVAECKTDEASFLALADVLWNAGINGVNVAGGRIIPAEAPEWLRDDDPSYLWFRAFYELNGEPMEVYLQYGGMDGDDLWIGVTYSPTDPDFEQWPQTGFPASDIKQIIGVDLPNPGGTVYAISYIPEGYNEINMAIEGLSREEYDGYVQNLKDGGAAGIVVDSNGGYDIFGYYGDAFYAEDYENFSCAINTNYIGGVMLLSVVGL